MKNVNKYNKEILIGETRRQVLIGRCNDSQFNKQTHTHLVHMNVHNTGYFSHSLCNVIATIFQ